jgi:hypothetical protein
MRYKNLFDRSILISGSCSPKTDIKIINFSHKVIRGVTKGLLKNGASIVVCIGKNPKVDEHNENSPSIIYDWDVIDEIYSFAKKSSFSSNTKNVGKVIATQKSLTQIPKDKQKIWDKLVKNGTVSIFQIPFGWNSGAIRRQKMESIADALIVIGGGEGVEHIAELFSLNGKPILPLDIPVGSSCEDGKGGAIYLSREFMSKTKKFIPIINQEQLTKAAMLSFQKFKDAPNEYAKKITDFVTDVTVPQVFFVRLQNKKIKGYTSVNKFFKNIVIPLVKDLNLSFKDMEISENKEAFLNVEIFKEINNSSFIIVDLTALRLNCFTEMGFSFGLKKKVILTAMDGTDVPFDTKSIPCFFWNNKKKKIIVKRELYEFWKKNVNRGPLVSPTEIV